MPREHDYEADPQSGAGNCVCGAAREHRRHPHRFVRSFSAARGGIQSMCVCGLPPIAAIHNREPSHVD